MNTFVQPTDNVAKIAKLTALIEQLSALIDSGVNGLEGKLEELQNELATLQTQNNNEESAPNAPVEATVKVVDAPVVTPKETAQDVEIDTAKLSADLQALMVLKENVRKQVLPTFANKAIADFQLVASVAESFAEDRTHTLVYEVIPEFQNQIQLANAVLSFRSIITDQISGLKLKSLQDKAKWSSVSVAYAEKQGLGGKRTIEDDQKNKIGSFNIATTEALKYDHAPYNLLGTVVAQFNTTSLDGLKTTTENELFDLDVSEARLAQKKWYVQRKSDVLKLAEGEFKDVTIAVSKIERYKLILTIAKLWGEAQYNNVVTVVTKLAKEIDKADDEKFAEALKKAIVQAQAQFKEPLAELPNDVLIANLEGYSRQTLPKAMESIGISKEQKKQINFYGCDVQGYNVEQLNQALAQYA